MLILVKCYTVYEYIRLNCSFLSYLYAALNNEVTKYRHPSIYEGNSFRESCREVKIRNSKIKLPLIYT
jgi:hypothetical protein